MLSVSKSLKMGSGTQIPIFMFHYIEDQKNSKGHRGSTLFVSPKHFEADLQWLTEHQYHTIDLQELQNILQHKATSPTKPIVLTFDDGYEDAYVYAFPLLEKYHMKAVFYIISGFVAKTGYLTGEQIQDMALHGMSIGAHTVSHPDLRKLTPEKLESELSDSKKALETLLGKRIPNLAFPSGKYNRNVLMATKALDYATAVTTHFGYANAQSHLLTLPRIRITNRTKMDRILRK